MSRKVNYTILVKRTCLKRDLIEVFVQVYLDGAFRKSLGYGFNFNLGIRQRPQALDKLKPGPVLADAPKIVLPPKQDTVNTIEGLIHHFKIISEGFKPDVGEVYVGVENPKGEVGFYLVSDGSPRPYRMKIRPASFINLQALPKMCEGSMIADVVAVIGTLDIVLGEIDR